MVAVNLLQYCLQLQVISVMLVGHLDELALLLLPLPVSLASVCCLNTASLSYMIPFGLGAAVSNEQEVVDYVASMMPLLAASTIMDGIQGVLSGIARGCGWQKLGAYVNLGAYYVVGIPVAVTLAFVLHVGGKGLWLGIFGGLFTQTILLVVLTSCTDWQQQARKARERVYASALPRVTDEIIKDENSQS